MCHWNIIIIFTLNVKVRCIEFFFFKSKINVLLVTGTLIGLMQLQNITGFIIVIRLF